MLSGRTDTPPSPKQFLCEPLQRRPRSEQPAACQHCVPNSHQPITLTSRALTKPRTSHTAAPTYIDPLGLGVRGDLTPYIYFLT